MQSIPTKKGNKGEIMKRLTLFFAAVLMVLWGVQSRAAVKWDLGVEVKQDFNIQRGFDLNDDRNNPIATRGSYGSGANAGGAADIFGLGSGEKAHWLETLVALNGSATIAGLGGNDVIFFARLVSQFDWLGAQTTNPAQTSMPGTHSNPAGAFPTFSTETGTNPFSLMLNQAYVKFVEFNGWPIDFTIGRQNIWLGKGFIVGSRLLGGGPTIYAGGVTPSGSRDPGTNPVTIGGQDGQNNWPNAGNLPLGSQGGTLHAPHHSDFTGFDALRADFRWKEWYLNGGWALVAGALTESVNGAANGRITRRNIGTNRDDEWFTFTNVGYNSPAGSKYRWNAEVYIVNNIDNEPREDRDDRDSALNIDFEQDMRDRVTTFGLRGDIDYKNVLNVENIGLYVEGAYQRGRLGANPSDTTEGGARDAREREAFAANAGVDVAFKHKWSPWAGAEYVYFSGPKDGEIESDDGVAQVTSGTLWRSWDPVFRGKSWTLIMDTLDAIYLTDRSGPDHAGLVTNLGKVDAAFTNRHIALAKAGADFTNKLGVSGTFAWAMAVENPFPIASDRVFGYEIDVHAKYKMTKSILGTLSGGFFSPGGYYDMPEVVFSSDKDEINAWTVQAGIKIELI